MKNKVETVTSVLILVLAAVYFVQLRFWLTEDPKITSYELLAQGKAYLPCQFRYVVPWLARTLSSNGSMTLERAYKILEILAVVTLIISFRYLVEACCSVANPWVWAGSIFYPLLYIYVLPPWARRQPYDLWATASFSLGLYLLIKERWTAYYIFFPLATANSEKTCFLTMAYLLINWRSKDKQKRIAIHVFAQAVLWLVVKCVLWIRFMHNPRLPGTPFFMLPVMENFRWLANPWNLIFLGSVFGYSWIPVLLFFRKLQSPVIRKLLFLLLPFSLGMLLVGILKELRIFGEMTPLVWLAVVDLFARRRVEDQRAGQLDRDASASTNLG